MSKKRNGLEKKFDQKPVRERKVKALIKIVDTVIKIYSVIKSNNGYPYFFNK